MSSSRLTSGPSLRLIIGFTGPLLVGNVVQQLYTFTDAAVVGRVLGIDALAAVGATGALTFIVTGFIWGMSAGLGIPIAHAVGAGDPVLVRRRVAAGAGVAGVVAVTIALAGVFTARLQLAMLGTPAPLVHGASTFLVVTYAGAGIAMAFNYVAAVIRALGDSRTPLVIQVLSSLLNVALVFAFVGVLHLGVGGAALATVVAQAIAVAACLRLVGTCLPLLRLGRSDWAAGRSQLRVQAQMGLPMGLQACVTGAGALILQWSLNRLGVTAVGAFTAASRVDQVALSPITSFGIAVSTFTAQNYGARQGLRIRRAVVHAWALTVGVSAALGLLNVVLGGRIVRLFVGDASADVIHMAHQYLAINGFAYVVLATYTVLRSALQGIGLTAVPTISGFMQLGLRTVAALVLVPQLGFLGISLAAPLAWVGALVPVAVVWRRHRHDLESRAMNIDRLAVPDPAA